MSFVKEFDVILKADAEVRSMNKCRGYMRQLVLPFLVCLFDLLPSSFFILSFSPSPSLLVLVALRIEMDSFEGVSGRNVESKAVLEADGR